MEEETQLSREHALLGNYDAAVKKHTTLVRRLEGAGAVANEAHIALTAREYVQQFGRPSASIAILTALPNIIEI